ncbi:lytic murein transglycosylase [Ottowia testudinis]|uniref:Lytic murein transglycosylase n=1 Tax=Ottowia testudinis TaxID=2816950 RepID=A0A975CIK7_9BURK|nr:lytic murein transglycosylase [Ottowia testudinis]QTD44849.1 lytic murein transglycosylase [Ottowia testudinis]
MTQKDCTPRRALAALALTTLLGAPALHAQEAPPAIDPAQFSACLSELKGTPAFRAISAATFAQHTGNLAADPSVLPLLNRQPEFTMPVWDYIAVLVDDERVADGRAAYAKWQGTLQKIEQQTGVAPHVVIGVWGVESNFGQNLGGRPLVQSLATLSCFGRRQAYFRGEFAAALRILQEGHIAPDKLVGSWAGAFGQTQFMPSTFFRSAVDFDGDGRRDIVDSVPDALASTAKFLQNAGYRRGEPWGFEVRLPPGLDTTDASRKAKRPIDAWRSAGLTLADGSPLPASLPSAGLMIPARGGPAFLVGRNFDTLYSYNASENYALAIAQLSNLVGGTGGSVAFVTPWPTDDPGLSRTQNRELQTLLLARGHDIGSADGMIGAKTREAIKAEQQRLGMKADGRAGQKLLAALRRA